MADTATRLPGEVLLRLEGVKRSFRQGDRRLDVLIGADAELRGGEAVALVGPSGAGKSTLLHIAGLLEQADAGRVVIAGRDCTAMDDGQRTRIRRVEMGFIYQFHQLLPEFSALENVVIPQMLAGRPRRVAGERARKLLAGLGLGERLDHRPAELSGGEQQRTAIARALANSPKVILADEPTGNLDPTTAGTVFQDLIRMIETTGVAALIATHNLDLAARMHRVLRLEGGRLAEVSPSRVAG